MADQESSEFSRIHEAHEAEIRASLSGDERSIGAGLRDRLAKAEGVLSVLKMAITWVIVFASIAAGLAYYLSVDLREQVKQTKTELRGDVSGIRDDVRALDRKIAEIPDKLTNLANTIANTKQAPIIIQTHPPSTTTPTPEPLPPARQPGAPVP